MKLSKTAEYALRILVFMAKEPDRLHTAKQLVDELNIYTTIKKQIISV